MTSMLRKENDVFFLAILQQFEEEKASSNF